jgi:adenine-specific DNA methylase
MLSSNQIPTSFEPRDYEIKALEKLSEFFFKWIQGILEDEIRYYETDERAKEEVAFFTAALIHMATGSGKTFTV